ncbi:MAG: HlyD family efflux transporter periplasmic adaptor subunit [Bryobacteraceae bacterium]
MNWKRTLVFVIIGGALAAAIYIGMQPQPLEVETSAANHGPLEVTVEEEGKTRLRDRFVVSPPLAGYLRRHPWKVGDEIRSGQAVATLEPLRAEVLDRRRSSENEARLRSASAAREGADARLASALEQLKATAADADYWKLQMAREEKLVASGDLPAERTDRTRAEVRRTDALRQAAEQAVSVARAEIARTRADVEAARAAASNPSLEGRALEGRALEPRRPAETITITAPVSGRVVKVGRQSEGVVTPGEAILELGNTRALEIEVELLSADAVKVSPGTPVRLTRWGGDHPLEARVRLIEPTGFTKISALGVEEQRVRVISDLVSPASEWQRLGEGYRVEAAFVLWRGERVLHIPSSALFREGEKWFVYAVEAGIARKRGVETGHRNGLTAEVTSGLKEGDVVIPHPDEKLKDGGMVKTRGS